VTIDLSNWKLASLARGGPAAGQSSDRARALVARGRMGPEADRTDGRGALPGPGQPRTVHRRSGRHAGAAECRSDGAIIDILRRPDGARHREQTDPDRSHPPARSRVGGAGGWWLLLCDGRDRAPPRRLGRRRSRGQVRLGSGLHPDPA